MTDTKNLVSSRLMTTAALRKAIEIAGGQKALADNIGTSQSMVWYWLDRSKKGVPGEYVLRIEGATGVSRHDLRPDLYPPTPARPSNEGRPA